MTALDHDAPRIAPARSGLGWCVVFGLALAAGITLRLWQIDGQIVLDDEWHALHKLLVADWKSVFTRFGFADHSIPLTLYYKWVYETFGLSERKMHGPMLVAGIALIALAPRLVKSWTDWPTRATWAGLLAISPLLVYHSRTARPYAITSLLTFIAFTAYWDWRRADRRRWSAAVAYVIATTLAGWLHPITLPFTLAPFVFDGIRIVVAALRRDRGAAGPTLGPLIALGGVTGAVLTALLLPPLLVDGQMLSAKGGIDWVTPESIYRTLLMLFGSSHALVLLALLLLSVWGALAFARRDPSLFAYLMTIAACGIAATVLARPQWVHHPLVLARYLIPILPIVLLFTAQGSTHALQRVTGSLRPPIVVLALALLVLQGPLPAQLHRPSQFTGHLRFQYDYDDAHNPYVTLIPKTPVPEFYRRLAALPAGSRLLVEAPWRLESHFNPHPWYQDVHRQRVRIGFVSSVCGPRDFGEFPEDRGLRFRNFDHLSMLLRGETHGADYLVLHRVPWTTPPGAEVEWPDVARCIAASEAVFGAPVYRDDTLVVFALKPERRDSL